LHIPPNDLAGFFARRIGGQHEEPWLDILLGGPEAVGLNPEQRKAAEMKGINLLHVEIERLFGAQCTREIQKFALSPPIAYTWVSNLLVEAFLSNGMDQQEADDQHHRAGYAMNGERFRPRPARPQKD
jgi:hypothetical protein